MTNRNDNYRGPEDEDASDAEPNEGVLQHPEDFSQGAEYLDDAIRMHEQALGQQE